MSGYTYEGHGLLIEVEDTDGFLDMYDSITGGSCEDMYDAENDGTIGDWCPPDNIDEAYRNGDQVFGGFLVIRFDEDGETMADLEMLAEIFGTTAEGLVADNECDFLVRCYQ